MDIKEKCRQQRVQMTQNFISLRKCEGLSRDELAAKTGIPEQILYDMESGEDFDLDYLFTLCDHYGLRPHQLFSPLEEKKC